MQTTLELERRHERRLARVGVNASWLIKLRWVAVAGQFMTIAATSEILQYRLPIFPLGLALGVTSLSNLALMFWFRAWLHRIPNQEAGSGESSNAKSVDKSTHPSGDRWKSGNRVLAFVMTLDLASLTSMLFFTGGAENPFCFFFFVNLSLSAVVLTNDWAWALTVLSVICFSFLLFDSIPLQHDSTPAFQDEVSTRLQDIRESGGIGTVHAGLFIAFATCASVIVSFMTRLNLELRQVELGLWRAETQQARNEKLQALGTLAAGAAHELSTPLSTIAVVAREVEHEIESQEADPHLLEDIRLIREELDRCRKILDRMNADAGQASGEAIGSIKVSALLDEMIVDHPELGRVQFECPEDLAEAELRLPKGVVAQALRGLIQNAIDASPDHQSIQVTVKKLETWIVIEIVDQGSGIHQEILTRVSEPFFTTKAPGQGMGLGLFLARTVVEQLGGEISIDSSPDEGTRVAVHFKYPSDES